MTLSKSDFILREKWIEFILLMFVISCGSHSKVSARGDEVKSVDFSLIESKEKKKVISQIDRLLNKYKACWQADSSREHRKCLFVKKVFEPALPKEESLGQRILILDGESQPSFYSAFFRYKKKVLSFLEQSSFGDGEFYEFFPVIKAPVVLDSIQDIVDHSNQQTWQVGDFRDVGSKLLKLYHQVEHIVPSQAQIAHGEYVFELLADLNPESQFVIGPFPLPDPELFCEMDSRWEELVTFYDNAASSLVDYIDEFQISWVNLSYSTTMESLKKYHNLNCRKPPDIKQLKNYIKLRANVVDKLAQSQSSPVILQALPNEAPYEVKESNPDYHFSCRARDYLFRVGFSSIVDHSIPTAGKHILPSHLPKVQQNLYDCGDFFINGGVDENIQENAKYFKNEWGRYFTKHSGNHLKLKYYGIYEEHTPLMATSWATPMGLSFLNYLSKLYKERGKELKPYELRAILWKKVWDPLGHRLFLRDHLLKSSLFKEGEFLFAMI